jgi:hypothetical protein
VLNIPVEFIPGTKYTTADISTKLIIIENNPSVARLIGRQISLTTGFIIVFAIITASAAIIAAVALLTEIPFINIPAKNIANANIVILINNFFI